MQEAMTKTNSVTLSLDKSAAIKGLLISLVALGHNPFFGGVFSSGQYSWLYSFHVALFFVLPFFYPAHEFSWSRVRTYAKRLLWPYTWMFVLLFLVDFFILKQAKLDAGLFLTFVTGGFYTLRHYTGFQYLWFLPAMFSMLCFKDIYTSASRKVRRMLLVLGVLFFVFVWVFIYKRPYDYSVSIAVSHFSVLSFMIGWAMFFLGSVTKWVVYQWRWSMALPASVMALTLTAMSLADGSALFGPAEWLSRILNPVACMLLLANSGLGGVNLGF